MQADTPVTFLGMTMQRRTKWNFLCEATNAALLGPFFGVVGPFALPLAVRMGATPLEVALISSGPFIANLLAPLWASLSRNHRKLPWVVWPNAIHRGSLGLLGLIASPHIMTALITWANLAAAAAQPAYGALVQKVFPAPIRGRLMGYIRVVLACGMLPTTLVAGQLLDRVGPRWLFLAAGLLGLAAIIIYSRTQEPPDDTVAAGLRPPTDILGGLRLAFSDPRFSRFLLAVLLFHGGVLVANPLYSVFQVKEMGLSNVQISYIALAWNTAWLSGFGFWGRMVDRRGAAFVVAGAALFYLGLPLAYGLSGTFAVVLVGALCQGFADAAMDLGGWNMILSTKPDRVGAYTSAHMTMAGVRGVLGPLLGSSLLQTLGFRFTFLTAAVLIAMGLILFTTANRRQGTPAAG